MEPQGIQITLYCFHFKTDKIYQTSTLTESFLVAAVNLPVTAKYDKSVPAFWHSWGDDLYREYVLELYKAKLRGL